MSFLICDNKSLSLTLDDSSLAIDEKILIEKLWALFEKHGFDLDYGLEIW